MKKILSMAIATLMFSSMAFGMSAVVNSDGTSITPEEGMVAITAIAEPEDGTEANEAGEVAKTLRDVDGSDDVYTIQDTEGGNAEDLRYKGADENAKTDETLAEKDELMYATGAPEATEKKNNIILNVVAIAGAVVIIGIPVASKLMKKAE